MSVLELANAMDKDLGILLLQFLLICIPPHYLYLDHIFEVMIYIDNSADYDQPWKCIDNIKVIQEIVKKSGMRCMITGAPTHENLNKEIKDLLIKQSNIQRATSSIVLLLLIIRNTDIILISISTEIHRQ